MISPQTISQRGWVQLLLKLVASGITLGIPTMLLANMYLADTPDSMFSQRQLITILLIVMALGGTVMLWLEINQRERAERLVEDQSEVLKRQALIAANIDHMVVMTDTNGKIDWVNASFTRLSGWQAHEVKGRASAEILSGPRQQDIDLAALYESGLRDHQGFHATLQIYSRDGRAFWVDLAAHPLFDKQGNIAGHVTLLADITRRKQQEQELERIAYYDALTGLANRELLLLRLRQALAREGEERPALIYIKFPRAAALRGTLGQDVNDALIQAVVHRLGDALTEQQLLARLSASAFAILAPVRRPAHALSIAYMLQSVLAKPHQVGDREVHLVSSIGVSVPDNGHSDAIAMLRDAEIAAQSTSNRNMDEVVLFDVAMRQKLEARHQMETDLRRAIYFDTNQLAVAFQPIVDLHDLRLVGFESLARWRHPEKGWIPPDQFIGIAEETGMIVPLWNFVFAEACRHLVKWQALRPNGAPPLFVSVNLSATQFFYPGLLRSVGTVVEVTRVDPRWIKFEITESGLMENAEAALQQMESLKAMGCTLSIDDFGTGYSSLSYLQKLPVDDIKIDRSFIMAMHKAASNREIVRIITELGRILNKRVIAEGIETELDLHVLRQLGCDFGQGYHFHKPMFADQAEPLVIEHARRLTQTAQT